MNQLTAQDIFEWDYQNWSRSLPFWQAHLPKDRQLSCLEIGSRHGGPSAWLASLGHKVVCSDLTVPESAKQKHADYPFAANISYASVNLKDIQLTEKYDVIIFKSVLGGVARNNDLQLAKEIASQLRNHLNDKGVLLFAENLRGSFLHHLSRKILRKWGASWSYFSRKDFSYIFSDYSELHTRNYGFFGAFGVNPFSKQIFSRMDSALDPVTMNSCKYIIFGVAKK